MGKFEIRKSKSEGVGVKGAPLPVFCSGIIHPGRWRIGAFEFRVSNFEF
jgi:hypothetical protein